MAAKTTSTTRGNLILAAGAIVALSAMVAGCQTDYATLMYDQEAHAYRVAAWCRTYSGVSPASALGQDCIRRAWVGVPASKCVYGCIDQFKVLYRKGHHRVPHHPRRGLIYK